MCGIAGFVGGDWGTAREIAAILARMNLAVLHRGPDHSGSWIDDEARVAFAHDRLAIIDRSPAGNQPMESPSGRWVISYNGEIYNHQEIREELKQAGLNHAWRGHSDTETLLAAIDAWGVREALRRSKGMFALALWDRSERQLILARDRIGEKPLYYGRQEPGGPFLFGSELKALREHPQFLADIDRDAVALLLRHNYIPAPCSIYRGIRKLPPGCVLSLGNRSSEPVIERYWSGADVAEAGLAKPLELSDDEAVDMLEQRLGAAISGQMIADVPLGAFLSGGIDSSTVVALMQRLSSRPVKTFTIGFHETAFNEAEHAKAVAIHLGTEHTELYVTAAQARDVIPKLPCIYDEPFADSSQIPTHLIAQLAREHVTVALSGDAGDELFGGYDRYLVASGLWQKMSGVPRPIRGAAAKAAMAVPAGAWTKFGNASGPFVPKLLRMTRLGDKVHRGAPLLRSQSVAELYEGLLSLWHNPGTVVIGADGRPDASTSSLPAGLRGIDRMMATDMLAYLPDDILVKVDRAAMAVSLETRAPFL
ncbi:MAG TPA: asparagine synthase (glutamine-hydrolyzing), partial [Sphingomicrobium sp.]